MSFVVCLTLLLWTTGCATATPSGQRTISRSGDDYTLQLARYQGRLRIVRVKAANREWQFLFDTGGGTTLISPEVAAALGCTARGRATGHRMNGDPFVTSTCATAPLVIGGWTAPAQTLGIFDLMELLPKDWPRLDGVISLRSFAGRRITLHLASNSLVIHQKSTRMPPPRAAPITGRIATGPSGAELLAFAAAQAGADTLWLLVDSGNLDAVLVAPHSARLLGLHDSVGTEHPDISIPLSPGVPTRVRARVRDLILDGAINAEWLERGELTIDLSDGRMWWRSNPLSARGMPLPPI